MFREVKNHKTKHTHTHDTIGCSNRESGLGWNTESSPRPHLGDRTYAPLSSCVSHSLSLPLVVKVRVVAKTSDVGERGGACFPISGSPPPPRGNEPERYYYPHAHNLIGRTVATSR